MSKTDPNSIEQALAAFLGTEVSSRAPAVTAISTGIHLPRADLPKDFLRLAEKRMAEFNSLASTKIFVVGYDLPHLAVKNTAARAEFKQALEGWLRKGATIDYVVIGEQNGNRTVEELEKMQLDGWKWPGCINVSRIPSAWAEKHPWIAKFKTQHFALIQHPDLLWIEGYHPPGENYALDCRFFNATATDNFQDYFSIFRGFAKRLKHEAKPLATFAPAHAL